MLGKSASALQTNVAVSNNNVVTGTLEYVTGYTGFSSDTELQSGHYVALKWNDPAAGVTSLKVGIVPSSIGREPVECIDDTDRNGVFRVTDPTTQKVVIIQSDGTHTHRQELSLRNLVLNASTGA